MGRGLGLALEGGGGGDYGFHCWRAVAIGFANWKDDQWSMSTGRNLPGGITKADVQVNAHEVVWGVDARWQVKVGGGGVLNNFPVEKRDWNCGKESEATQG